MSYQGIVSVTRKTENFSEEIGLHSFQIILKSSRLTRTRTLCKLKTSLFLDAQNITALKEVNASDFVSSVSML